MQSSFVSLQSATLDYAQRVQSLLQCTRSPQTSLSQCYTQHDALTVAWSLVVLFALYSFLWSLLGRNCSKVDQIWSVTPVVFAWHFLLHHLLREGVLHARLTLLAVLVSLWGVRLTYNFYRKGGYGDLLTHEEDYRWPILRKMMHPFVFWVLFNLCFIATYQNVLLFLIAAPAAEIAKSSALHLLPQDYV